MHYGMELRRKSRAVPVSQYLAFPICYAGKTGKQSVKGHHHPSKANKLARWVRQQRSYDVGCRRSACRAEGFKGCHYERSAAIQL